MWKKRKNVREISAPPCGPESSTGRDSESVSVFAFRGVSPRPGGTGRRSCSAPFPSVLRGWWKGSETDRPEKVSGTRLWWKIFTLSLVAAGREVGTRANLKNRLFSEEPNRAAAAPRNQEEIPEEVQKEQKVDNTYCVCESCYIVGKLSTRQTIQKLERKK